MSSEHSIIKYSQIRQHCQMLSDTGALSNALKHSSIIKCSQTQQHYQMLSEQQHYQMLKSSHIRIRCSSNFKPVKQYPLSTPYNIKILGTIWKYKTLKLNYSVPLFGMKMMQKIIRKSKISQTSTQIFTNHPYAVVSCELLPGLSSHSPQSFFKTQMILFQYSISINPI